MLQDGVYEKLIVFVKRKVFTLNNKFNEYDIVHDIYLDEKTYDYTSACKAAIGFIKRGATYRSIHILDNKNYRLFEKTRVCSKCKEDLPVVAFRMRIEKRGIPFQYVNSDCVACERRLQKERTDKIKHTDTYKATTRASAKNYRLKNPEKYKLASKKKRSTEEYKEYVRNYYQENRERIRELAKIARLKRCHLVK